MQYDPSIVGKRIEKLLNASGMKYGDFARRIKSEKFPQGRSPSAVSAWLRGDELTPEVLFNMAQIFGVSIDCIMGNEAEFETVIRTKEEREMLDNFEALVRFGDPDILDHLVRQLRLFVKMVRK